MVQSETLAKVFKQREDEVLTLIESYNLNYIEIGIFGSYARGEFKTTSDIDFCIITNNKPPRQVSGSLREEAELLGADIVFVTEDYFKNNTSNFAQQLRRDYRRCNL